MSSSGEKSDEEDDRAFEASAVPGYYHSPISGFLLLPDVETVEQTTYSTSTESLPRSMSPSDDDFEAGPSMLRTSVKGVESSLQVSPPKLSKPASTQTLRADPETTRIRNGAADLDWDKDSPTKIPKASSLLAHTSNTWSASSKAVKAIADALKSSDDADSSLSCSLPAPSHMPQHLVRESWDEDFLFQDDGEKESGQDEDKRGRTTSTRRSTDGRKSINREEWDEDEGDDEDWGASSSAEEKPGIHTSVSVNDLVASRSVQAPIDFSSVQRHGSDQHSSSTSAGPSSNLQSFMSQRRVARQSQSTGHTDSGLFFQDKIAARSDASNFSASAKRSVTPSTKQQREEALPQASQQTTELKMSPIVARRATSNSTTEETPRSTFRNVSENLLQTTKVDSPAKVSSRQAEGHWSHFLSSKLSQAKSPEKASKLKPIKLDGSRTLRGIASTSTNSPPVSPSALRSRELSMSREQPDNEEASGRSKATHRRGGSSLSMSFGFIGPWGWPNRSSNRVAESAGSLAGASTSSVSLASITADTGRSRGDTAAIDDFRYTSKQATSGLQLKRGVSQRHSEKADRRSQGENQAIGLTNEAAEPTRTQVSSHSPSSFRPQSMMLGTRSYSGSTSTATTAMSSSDCATSTGSFTEESTLYGSVDDASKLPSPGNLPSSKVSPSLMRESAKIDDITYHSTGQEVSPASRKGSYATRPAIIEHVLSPATSMKRNTDISLRLPSDPTSSAFSRTRGSPEQHEVNSKSADSLMRRSSLSDLKIPSRITRAQEGFRSNMNMVKDFANGIEELKMLREKVYFQLDQYPVTDPRRIEVQEEYGSWWECAEVLIGLGQGRGESDNEANVDSLDHIQPFVASPTMLSTTTPAGRSAQERSTSCSRLNNPPIPLSPVGARPPSSRGSSTRSIDPQREVDILNAMLAGLPVEGTSPARPTFALRERTMSAVEIMQSDRRGSGIMKAYDPQGRLPLAGISNTSLSFADAPLSHGRSRSHKTSASLSRSAYLQQGEDKATAATRPPSYSRDSGMPALGHISTESVDTQIATRRKRMRSTGKAGLQGLKELLRIFKISSTALVYEAELSQSRVSLNRTVADEGRISFAEFGLNADTNDEARPKPVSRTRSMFGRAMSRTISHSPTLHRRPLSINLHDSRLSTRSSSGASSTDPSTKYLGRDHRDSSATECSTKDTSLDSEWTQGDFDQVGAEGMTSDTNPDISMNPSDTLSPKLSAGKRRFFLFSKGFPPSAARRHSRDILHWASDSRESFDSSPTRHSLQLPARELHCSPPHSPHGGMPRVTSGAKHPLLNTRSTFMERSFSASSYSTSSSLDHDLAQPALKSSIIRPSKGSTAATVSTIESNSSCDTQIATPNTEPARPQTTSAHDLALTPSPDATDLNRKLTLKAEALPSLLVYLETTKARCLESLSLLD